MRLVLLLTAIGSAAVLAACADGVAPAQPLGLTVPGPPGSGRTTIRYATVPETALIRGHCAHGYMEVKPPTSPPQPLTCIYNEYSPHPIRARIGAGYPFSVGLRCFVSLVQFDGRLFASDSRDGRGLAASSGMGTMTLVSQDHARFVARNGTVATFHAVSFVRQPLCG